MRFIYFLLFASLSFSSFASSSKDWFDAPLKNCFEAIEEGKFKSQFRTTVKLAVPIEYVYPKREHQKKYAPGKKIGTKHCGVDVQNYFYDDKEYSLSRVLGKYTKSGGNTYYCEKLNAKSYAFCEYTKHKNVKGVRPIPW